MELLWWSHEEWDLGEKYSWVTIKDFDRTLQAVQYNEKALAQNIRRQAEGCRQKWGFGGWL